MMRILSPLGRTKEIRSAVPVVEAEVNFNGRIRQLREKAAGFDKKPTGIVLYAKQPGGMYRFDAGEDNLYIGNLKTEKVQVILRELAEKGYYDFSGMEYQKLQRGYGKQAVIDGGRSNPYNSETTPWAYPLELNSTFHGCMNDSFDDPTEFASCPPSGDDDFADEDSMGFDD